MLEYVFLECKNTPNYPVEETRFEWFFSNRRINLADYLLSLQHNRKCEGLNLLHYGYK